VRGGETCRPADAGLVPPSPIIRLSCVGRKTGMNKAGRGPLYSEALEVGLLKAQCRLNHKQLEIYPQRTPRSPLRKTVSSASVSHHILPEPIVISDILDRHA